MILFYLGGKMFLQSLKISNYRKFGETNNIISFVNSHPLEKIEGGDNAAGISQSSTLIIGKNNAGKTTITNALNQLVRKSPKDIKSSDFNTQYLKSCLESFEIAKSDSLEEFENNYHFPKIEFEFTINIQDKSIVYINNISNFISLSAPDDPIVIKASYQLKEEEVFRRLLTDRLRISSDYSSKINSLYEILDDEKIEFELIIENKEGVKVSGFSFSSLFSIDIIQANRQHNEAVLSEVYQKIIKASFDLEDEKNSFNNEITEINKAINEHATLTSKKEALQGVLQAIESNSHVSMNLVGNVTKDQILSNLIRYVFMDGEDIIPENQFGLGYINLLNIIGHITHYLDQYDEDSHKYKINMLFIEEPEIFMHPQMQEFFITRIDNAINKVLSHNEKLTLKCQVVITTHSSHIVNSKIHSSNSFNNINYITETDNRSCVVCLDDSNIVPCEENRELNLKFLKTHIKYKVSELFFADAVILVEGMTEDSVLPYFIDKDEELRKHYVSIFRVDGAHSKVYQSLIKLLRIPCLIITDMDIKRAAWEKNKDEKDGLKPSGNDSCQTTKKGYYQIRDLTDRETTNTTLSGCWSARSGKKDSKIFGKEYYTDDNLHVVYQKDAITDYYATSFEESILLSNHENKYLLGVLAKIMPDIYKGIQETARENSKRIIDYSYKIQCKLGDSSRKSKFSSELLYTLIVRDDHNIHLPKYIKDGFQWLKDSLGSSRKG